MIDFDEFLFIVNDTLKNYLSNKIFDKCNFIKIHWALADDNDLLHYDPRPLFERFKPPYVQDIYIKSIVRSNISDMHYAVHSPDISPTRNVTCSNIGEVLTPNTSEGLNFQSYDYINVDKAFIIHFRFKTVEEFVIKYKRGYNDWLGEMKEAFLYHHVELFFDLNRLSWKKINYVEKELNLPLPKYKK